MYLITNRTLSKAKGLRAFGKTPSPKGPNELRLVSAVKSDGGWVVEPVADALPKETVKQLKAKYSLDIDVERTWHGSLQVACDLFTRARKEKKSILFFVHGYNNDVKDVLKAAHELEELYKVIVVPFTWPANGGGVVSGTASYLSDKSDARVSAGALNRTVGKIGQFHQMLIASQRRKLLQSAQDKHPNNPEAAAALASKLMDKQCVVKLSLLCHSMGNYVLKHTLSTSENVTSKLVFDNICLVAADTNNAGHATWVGQLDVRSRLYVVINEGDAALKVSRIKPGDEQKARLGHYTRRLNSLNAHYVDLTQARGVGMDHGYFKGDAVADNPELKQLFHGMFNGVAVEPGLRYHADNNAYTLSA